MQDRDRYTVFDFYYASFYVPPTIFLDAKFTFRIQSWLFDPRRALRKDA